MGTFTSEEQGRFFDSLQHTHIELCLPVQDVFTIPGRGVAACGSVILGYVKVNDVVEVLSQDGTRYKTRVLGLEKNRKLIDIAVRNDQIGILVKPEQGEKIERGDILLKLVDLTVPSMS